MCFFFLGVDFWFVVGYWFVVYGFLFVGVVGDYLVVVGYQYLDLVVVDCCVDWFWSGLVVFWFVE